MEIVLRILLFSTIALKCNAVSYLEELRHILETRRGSHGMIPYTYPSRRFDDTSVIVGSPTMFSHLPEAEAVIPGHTLIRPAIGMLKSAVKFPHKEMENGAGVYGNVNNLGLRYDGKNERILYSGFRRMPQDYIFLIMDLLSKLIKDSLEHTEMKPKADNRVYFEGKSPTTQENFLGGRNIVEDENIAP